MRPGRKQLKLKIGRRLLRSLKFKALSEDRTVSDIVAEAIERFPEIDGGDEDAFHITSLSVPEGVVDKIDRIARGMFTTRTSALLIVISWYQNQGRNEENEIQE